MYIRERCGYPPKKAETLRRSTTSANYLTIYKAKCYCILGCASRLKVGAIFSKITL